MNKVTYQDLKCGMIYTSSYHSFPFVVVAFMSGKGQAEKWGMHINNSVNQPCWPEVFPLNDDGEEFVPYKETKNRLDWLFLERIILEDVNSIQLSDEDVERHGEGVRL